MSFISRHKFATFTVVMFLILIVLGVALFRFLVPNYELDEYGNRCDKSNKYKIYLSDFFVFFVHIFVIFFYHLTPLFIILLPLLFLFLLYERLKRAVSGVHGESPLTSLTSYQRFFSLLSTV